MTSVQQAEVPGLRAGRPAPARRPLSGLAAAIMLAISAALAGAALFGMWAVLWLLSTSLAGFLLGPGSFAGPDMLPEPFLLLPPLAAAVATLVVGWWLAATGRLRWGGPAAAQELPDSGAEEAHAPGVSIGWTVALLIVGCLGYLAYARLVFLYHRIDGGIDEGIYLYAARLVMSGQVPYRDFAFLQAPLLPYVLGLALAPFSFQEGAARLFAIGCTLATLLVTFFAAARMGGRLAGLLAFGLLVTNLDFLTELSAGVRSNGSLTALVVALTALALALGRPGLALPLAAIATGIRLTFAPLAVVIAAYLAFARYRPRLALFGGAAMAALVFVPFLLLAGERALFWLLVQGQRAEVFERWYGLAKGIRAHLIHTHSGVLDIAYPYLPFFLGAIPAFYLVWTRGHPRWRELTALAASSLAILLLNISPQPVNPRYPVTQLPLLAVLDGVALALVVQRLRQGAPGRLGAASFMAALGLLLAVAPLLAWRESSFIHTYKYRPPAEGLNEVASYVRSLAGPNATLLTLETPVASQSGLRLLRGLELGNWSIVRGMSEERARTLGVVTYDMLIAMVEGRQAQVVVASDRYGFARNYAPNPGEQQRMNEALGRNYVRQRTFDLVSDWGDVRVYTPRAD